MRNVIIVNAAAGRVARAIRAQYYKNSLRNLEVGGGREDSDDSPRDGIQESTTCFHCLRYGRSEEMKRWRRLVGDRGGIKFQGRLAKVRDDGCVNTITNSSKDNLIMIQWQR